MIMPTRYIVPKQQTITTTLWTEICEFCGNKQELKSEMKSVIEFNDMNYSNEEILGLTHTDIEFIEPKNICNVCGNIFKNN